MHRLMAKDIHVMWASRALDEMELAKRIDRSMQRSVSRWAAWRRKREAEKQAQSATTQALKQAVAA